MSVVPSSMVHQPNHHSHRQTVDEQKRKKLIKVRNCNDGDGDAITDLNNIISQQQTTDRVDDDDDDDADDDGDGEDANSKQLVAGNRQNLLLNRRRSCRRRNRRLCCSYNNSIIINSSNTTSTSTKKELPDCKVRRNYTCSNCEFFTQNPRLYLYHLRDVHFQRIRVYECPNCLYASKHFQKLLRHTKMVHGINNNNAANSPAEVTKRSTRKHSAAATATSPTPDAADEETEETSGNAHDDEQQQQQQQILDEDSLIDEIPLDVDAAGAGTNDDIDDIDGNSSSLFKCSICSFTSRGPLQLTKHEREEHIKTKFFRCSKCTYVTHIKARYTKHVKYHSMPMIKCDMCDFRTPYKWNLDRHCKNHNGKGQFRCSACNFTADIKQSLTVHEMNHHVPPVGQAAGIGVGRRRNKVGASDTQVMMTATTDDLDGNNQLMDTQQIAEPSSLIVKEEVPPPVSSSTTHTRSKTKIRFTALRKQSKQSSTNSNNNNNFNNNNNNSNNGVTSSESSQGILGSDFIHPDDFIHHSNGKVYIKIKCKLCNYKTAWDSEMARHERKMHNINRETTIKLNEKSQNIKKTLKPIPNLIPIPSRLKLNRHHQKLLKTIDIDRLVEPVMSEKDINDIYNRSTNSSLKDLASLFRFEDVMKNPSSNNCTPTTATTIATTKVPDLIPASSFINNNNNNLMTNARAATMAFKQKNASFFDRLKEKLEIGTGCNNLICTLCGHESKCLTEQVKHQKICHGSDDGGNSKDITRVPNIIPVHNISASRCQYCRQRCKSSADLYNHLQSCREALKFYCEEDEDDDVKREVEEDSSEHELKIEEDDDDADDDDDDDVVVEEEEDEHFDIEANEMKPHPMENKVFVWNNIVVPMDIEVDDSNYEYTEDRIDDNVSLDLSIRTQSPASCSENSLNREPETSNNNNNNNMPSTSVHRRHVTTRRTTATPVASLQHSVPVKHQQQQAPPPLPASSSSAVIPPVVQTPPEKIPTHGNDISIAQHKRVFKCPHCSFWASTASRFHVHIVGHLNKKPFECSLCSYRSNWRWDITKHIKLKSVRDQAHESAKVLMTDETGRRNYSKYNKYLTEIPLSSLQSSTETSGGSGTRPRNQQHDNNNRNHSPIINNNNNNNHSKSDGKGHHYHNNNNKTSNPGEISSILKSRSSVTVLPPPPPLRNMDKHFFANIMQDKRKNANGATPTDNNNKRTMFKCKKCNFRDISRDILLQHVKGHYPLFDEHHHHLQQQYQQQQHHQHQSSGLAAISPQSTSLFAASAYPAMAAAVAAAAISAGAGVVCTESSSAAAAAAAAAAAGVASPYIGLQDLSLRGTSPDRDEASVNNSNATLKGCTSTTSTTSTTTTTTTPTIVTINAPFRCGHCNQVSNWKHVIQRHCRLKHNGDIRVVSTKNGQEKIEIEDQLLLDDSDCVDQQQSNSGGGGGGGISSGSAINLTAGGGATYKCTICPYATNSLDDYQQHSSGHDDDSPNNIFKCNICKYGVAQEEYLFSHLKLHGICDPIEYIKSLAPTSADFECKKFRCMLCPYVTNSKSQYTYHKQFHKARGGQYTCSCCSYNVSKRHLLHQHLKVHGISASSKSPQNGGGGGGAGIGITSGNEMIIDDDPNYEMIEEEDISNLNLFTADFDDIPLVWVAKNERFSKMYKCRYCPHVNMRKVNIHEHEKMHKDASDGNGAEYKCSQCNYVCSNAGVLSTHIKFHQGCYGIVQSLVDFNKSDEEQIKELQEQQSPSDLIINTSEFLEVEMDDSNQSINESILYFCNDCPARFLKEKEYEIHRNFHTNQYQYKCDNCSFSTETESYLLSHLKVHQSDYQERTATLKNLYSISTNHPAPILKQMKSGNGESVWKVIEPSQHHQKNNILVSFLKKPLKSGPVISIPLSGTDLFQKKSEAQQQQQQQQQQQEQDVSIPNVHRQNIFNIKSSPQLQFGEKMQGNPEFIYQKYIKNGRMKEKRYKCHKCPTAFEKRGQYKGHLGLHGSKQRFNCESCDYSVKYYANYAQHLKKHKFNDEAHAAAASETTAKRNNDNDANDDTIIIKECVDDDHLFKLSVADQQMVNITEQRTAALSSVNCNNTTSSSSGPALMIDDKKMYDCHYCPYINGRKDALENHMRRHEIVSGYKSSYQCEHCDYSVPQAHFLREHIKLHFIPKNNTKTTNHHHQVNGYMICDNLKLISKGLVIDEASSKIDNDDNEEFVIYNEENEMKYNADDDKSGVTEEKFNNNNNNINIKGDEIVIDTGDLVVKSEEISDIHTVDKNNCQMEVN